MYKIFIDMSSLLIMGSVLMISSMVMEHFNHGDLSSEAFCIGMCYFTLQLSRRAQK